MDERDRNGGKDLRPIQPQATEESTLLPMLIGGLVLIVIGMIFVMWLA